MHGFEFALITVPAERHCEDRVAVFEFSDRLVIVVADGAGGTANGDLAAQAIVDEVGKLASLQHNDADWCELLRQIDHQIRDGESTGVVVAVSANGIVGASVGDSQAWLIQDDSIIPLTRNQIRKPLLGSGEARPIGFCHSTLPGLLVVATDGFCNYVKQERFLREVRHIDFTALPQELVEMVRLPSRALWDDVGIVVCRPAGNVANLTREEVKAELPVTHLNPVVSESAADRKR